MEAIRKITTNQVDINIAQQYNVHMAAEYAGSYTEPKLAKVPEPVFSTQLFSFRLEYVNSFYVEKDTINNKEDGDIIINLLYDGLVRLQYDPLVEARLNMYLNIK